MANDQFDNWLEAELKAALPNSPALPTAKYQSMLLKGEISMKSHVLFSGKAILATTGAVIALLAGVSAVAAAATTGSTNPVIWGQVVTAAVQTCKADLTNGNHGIGQCVSAIAKQKGAQERAAHSQGKNSPEPTPSTTASPSPKTEGKSDAHKNNGTEGKSDNHPTGKPTKAPRANTQSGS